MTIWSIEEINTQKYIHPNKKKNIHVIKQSKNRQKTSLKTNKHTKDK